METTMKALIVLAYPEERSLTSSLAKAAETQLVKRGDEAQFTGLYVRK